MAETTFDMNALHTIAEWNALFEEQKYSNPVRQEMVLNGVHELVITNLDTSARLEYLRVKTSKGLVIEPDSDAFNGRLVKYLQEKQPAKGFTPSR